VYGWKICCLAGFFVKSSVEDSEKCFMCVYSFGGIRLALRKDSRDVGCAGVK
jgi:hypothetical protein